MSAGIGSRLRRLLGGGARSPRPRGGTGVLALFTPLPPEQTGVAAYSARLIAELAELVPVDVYVADDVQVDPIPDAPVAPASSFAAVDAKNPYGHVLYCMGNSNFHHFMWEELQRRPGHVLAHDVRFEGFFRLMAMATGDVGAYQDRVAADAPAALDALGADGLLTAADAVAHDVYMVREVLSHATRLLVHSEYAAEVAARHGDPGDVEKIEVVRFGIPPPRVAARHPDESLVATFGLTDPIKLPDLVLQAAATCGLPGVTVAFVGFTDPGYEAALRAVGRDAGLDDRQMVFTGYLEEPEYASWLARATVAVQLRAASNGETSAAVADCLRHGVPTIVAAIGSGREYPPEVTISVPVDGPGALAEAIGELLGDAERRRRMTAAAIAFVERSSFAVAARSIARAMGIEASR